MDRQPVPLSGQLDDFQGHVRICQFRQGLLGSDMHTRLNMDFVRRTRHLDVDSGGISRLYDGCGLDAMWQLLGFYLTWLGAKGKGRALGSGEVKFFGQVLPTAKLVTFQIDIKRVITRRLNMIIADASMSVDGREIYTAEGLRVGLFTSTDNF